MNVEKVEKNTPQISVIIPIYNVKEYIKECLDSLQRQTFKDFEIICIDDCSTDGTSRILEEYADTNNGIKVYKNEVNMGAAESRNNGLQYARGKYVIFLDSDDIFHDDLLEKLYFSCEKNNSQAAFCMYEVFDQEHSSRIAELYPKHLAESIDSSNRYLLFEYMVFFPCNKLVLKELLEREDITFQNIKNANDVYYSLMVTTMAERVSLVKEGLISYRTNRKGNLSEYRDTQKTYLIDAFEKYLKTITKRNWLKRDNQVYVFDMIVSQVFLVYCQRPAMVSEQIRKDFLGKIVPLMNEEMVSGELKLSQMQSYQYEFLNGWTDKKSKYQVYVKEIEEYLAERRKKIIAVWGAGQLGVQFMEALAETNEKIDYIIDNDENKWGTYLCGCEITAFDNVKKEVDEVIVLNPRFLSEIEQQVSNACKVVSFEDISKEMQRYEGVVNAKRN